MNGWRVADRLLATANEPNLSVSLGSVLAPPSIAEYLMAALCRIAGGFK